MAENLFDFLSGRDEFVSGQEIADRLGISRNAVWKAVQKARREGYDIEAVPRKGYRIRSTADAFGAESIRAELRTKWLGAGDRLIYKKETGSTNEDIKQNAEKGAPEGLMIVADTQTAGKGRRGRSWQTPSGVNIAMSYLMRPDFVPDLAPMMTLVVALAAAEGINKATGLETGIKWPNDIVINGKKLVGILTEMSIEPDFINYVVIGTGINVNQEDFPEEIKATATSLMLETGSRVSRSAVVGAVTTAFEKYYEIFRKNDDLSELVEEYDRLCVNVNNKVRVLDPKGEWNGTASGINARGELLVTREDGTETAVYAGEVSVRGVYGYV
ncbi:BirA family transcriptional regulator, biotin operon repressor / biotin-[acetyl-CoA-carboxylase] ligase [Lachnospiraceae bacterium]|nr:BirA family transcriptional regulator, biotin operon repressor / biotin-[acetyl-CoA-carboxylase] ligase [Lachnospiraceae bacterium]